VGGAVSGAAVRLYSDRQRGQPRGSSGLSDDLMHIGRVADLVGLSLRTIRYYEEAGLVTPSGRTSGRFRLYNAQDVERLLLIKRMKPLGYPLEEMARLLRLLDAMTGQGAAAAELTPADAAAQLRAYAEAVDERIKELQRKVEYAQEFRDRILRELDLHSPEPPPA
jgi:MerR family copper efflux transcriptional regulator